MLFRQDIFLLPQTLAGAEEKLTVFQFSIQLFTEGNTLRGKLFCAGASFLFYDEMKSGANNNNIHKIQMKTEKLSVLLAFHN